MAELDLDPAKYILLDIFPSTVTTSEGVIGPEARTILTDTHLYVIMDAPTGPELALKVPFTEDYEGSVKEGLQIGEYFVEKQATCGCGSRLRGIYPFIGVPFLPTR